MSWKVALTLTVVGLTPLSAQRGDRHRSSRIEIPPIVVDVPEVRVNIPAINIEIPSFRFDFSNLGAEIESAVNEAMSALHDIDIRVATPPASDVNRVQRLKREWRAAIKRGDWQEADDLARQLSRLADRLKY
jgi:hypothetical protein